METAFAFLIILCSLLGVWALWATMNHISSENKNRKETEPLGQKEVLSDNMKDYSQPLTKELIARIISLKGYKPKCSSDGVVINDDGVELSIRVTALPILIMYKVFEIPKDQYNSELLNQASRIVIEEMLLVRASVLDEKCSIVFEINAFENCYGNFYDAFEHYVKLINLAAQRCEKKYWELVDARAETDWPEAGYEDASSSAVYN